MGTVLGEFCKLDFVQFYHKMTKTTTTTTTTATVKQLQVALPRLPRIAVIGRVLLSTLTVPTPARRASPPIIPKTDTENKF